MSIFKNATVVLIHGAWADGSSWEPVIRRLQNEGLNVLAAPIPLTSHAKAPKLAPDADGFIWMPDESFAEAFAQDATPEQIALCRAVQRPVSVKSIQEPVAAPASKTKPAWYLLAEEDRMISPKTQRFMAERMNATIRSFPVDHTPLLTAPDKAAGIILEAVKATAA